MKAFRRSLPISLVIWGSRGVKGYSCGKRHGVRDERHSAQEIVEFHRNACITEVILHYAKYVKIIYVVVYLLYGLRENSRNYNFPDSGRW